MRKKNIIIVIIILLFSNTSFCGGEPIDTVVIEKTIVKIDTISDKSKIINSNCININNPENEKKSTNSINYIPLYVGLLAGLVALLNVKANIISNARIDWAQNFRKTVSTFIAESTGLHYNLRRVVDLLNIDKDDPEATKLYHEQLENFKKVSESGSQIKLFLNNKNEYQHIKIENLIDSFTNKISNPATIENVTELDKLKNEIIQESQLLLKKVWEDAKTFNIPELLRISIRKKSNIN